MMPSQSRNSWVLRLGAAVFTLLLIGGVIVLSLTNNNPTPVPTLTIIVEQDTEEPTVTPPSVITPTQINSPELAQSLAQVGVSSNAEWIPYIEAFDEVPMALVPAGCFMMGSDANDIEQPIHEQCFDAPFWMDVYEVTNAQFAQFDVSAVNESRWDDPNAPRENVTWFEASDFCENKRGNDVRLPTEREWEYAARGVSNLSYPWGDDFVAENVVFNESRTADVGSLPSGMSWIGALDLSGNVWEWVTSAYREYEYDPNDGREDIGATNVSRVLRGGAFNVNVSRLRSTERMELAPERWSINVGFRCALSYAAPS